MEGLADAVRMSSEDAERTDLPEVSPRPTVPGNTASSLEGPVAELEPTALPFGQMITGRSRRMKQPAETINCSRLL